MQVVDLQVFALPRITLKPLVPSFPCFANIFVSLMEKVGGLLLLHFNIKMKLGEKGCHTKDTRGINIFTVFVIFFRL